MTLSPLSPSFFRNAQFRKLGAISIALLYTVLTFGVTLAPTPAEAELGRIDEVAVTFLVQQKYVRPPLICEWGEAELRAVGA